MRSRDYLPKIIHNWLSRVKLDIQFLILRYEQRRLLRKARRNVRVRPLRVLFLVNETSKWKTQSLYDALKADCHYEPNVVLIRADLDMEISNEEVEQRFAEAQEFFEKRGIVVEMAYDTKSGESVDPMAFKPDIIFYQHPWGIDPIQHPRRIAHRVLTCYVPYYVPNYGKISVEVQQGFHVYLWRYYLLNKAWCSEFRKGTTRLRCLPKFVASGHTMLDCYCIDSAPISKNPQGVIYAPHWSFNHPNHQNFENFSTFLKNGKEILAYAQAHPEMNWVFKPHPTLRHELYRSEAWSRDEIDDYYLAWERLGRTCYTGDYMPIFMESRAMITDCASFLVEYACTGNPIIHLVSSDRKIEPMKPSANLFETYYKVHDHSEMYAAFAMILERGEDPRRIERIGAVKSAGLIGVNAAKNIITDLNATFNVNSTR